MAAWLVVLIADVDGEPVDPRTVRVNLNQKLKPGGDPKVLPPPRARHPGAGGPILDMLDWIDRIDAMGKIPDHPDRDDPFVNAAEWSALSPCKNDASAPPHYQKPGVHRIALPKDAQQIALQIKDPACWSVLQWFAMYQSESDGKLIHRAAFFDTAVVDMRVAKIGADTFLEVEVKLTQLKLVTELARRRLAEEGNKWFQLTPQTLEVCGNASGTCLDPAAQAPEAAIKYHALEGGPVDPSPQGELMWFARRSAPYLLIVWKPKEIAFDAGGGKIDYHLYFRPAVNKPKPNVHPLSKDGVLYLQDNHEYMFEEKHLEPYHSDIDGDWYAKPAVPRGKPYHWPGDLERFYMVHHHAAAKKKVIFVYSMSQHPAVNGEHDHGDLVLKPSGVRRIFLELNHGLPKLAGVRRPLHQTGRVALSGFSQGHGFMLYALFTMLKKQNNAEDAKNAAFHRNNLLEIHNYDGMPWPNNGTAHIDDGQDLSFRIIKTWIDARPDDKSIKKRLRIYTGWLAWYTGWKRRLTQYIWPTFSLNKFYNRQVGPSTDTLAESSVDQLSLRLVYLDRSELIFNIANDPHPHPFYLRHFLKDALDRSGFDSL